MEVGLQISDHFLFFFRLLNDRWHDLLNGLAQFGHLRFKCLVRLGYTLLRLRTDDNILLCQPGARLEVAREVELGAWWKVFS